MPNIQVSGDAFNAIERAGHLLVGVAVEMTNQAEAIECVALNPDNGEYQACDHCWKISRSQELAEVGHAVTAALLDVYVCGQRYFTGPMAGKRCNNGATYMVEIPKLPNSLTCGVHARAWLPSVLTPLAEWLAPFTTEEAQNGTSEDS